MRQGNFRFDAVPAGNVKLGVDGHTATNAPAGIYFPEMVMDLTHRRWPGEHRDGLDGLAGRARRPIATGRKCTCRVWRRAILHDVSDDAADVHRRRCQSAPNLTPEQRALLNIQVQPGSLLDQNGNALAGGQVGISTVPPELVREMLPPGLLQHTFDITVQAPGITNFSTPAADDVSQHI